MTRRITKTPFSVRINTKIFERLTAAEIQTGFSRSALTERAIEEYLERHGEPDQPRQPSPAPKSRKPA